MCCKRINNKWYYSKSTDHIFTSIYKDFTLNRSRTTDRDHFTWHRPRLMDTSTANIDYILSNRQYQIHAHLLLDQLWSDHIPLHGSLQLPLIPKKPVNIHWVRPISKPQIKRITAKISSNLTYKRILKTTIQWLKRLLCPVWQNHCKTMVF